MELIRATIEAGHDVELWTIADPAPVWPDPAWPGLTTRSFPPLEGKNTLDKVKALVDRRPSHIWKARPGRESTAAVQQAASRFDVVVLEQADLAAFRPLIEATGLPFVVDAQNVESDLLRQFSVSLSKPLQRIRYRIDSAKYRPMERRLFESATKVAAVSEQDKQRILSLAPQASVVIHPSGVNVEYFGWQDHTKCQGRTMVMTAAYNHPPNFDAARWTVAELLPAIRRRVPDAAVNFVGSQGKDYIGELHQPASGVNVVGTVPDVRPYLAEADVFLCPLRLGGGTRLKVLDALASGIPVLATRVAVEGLDVAERELALVAETPEQFGRQAERLFNDVELRHHLTEAGRRYVEENFDWRVIGRGFAATLADAAASSAVSPSR